MRAIIAAALTIGAVASTDGKGNNYRVCACMQP
jgi:hypothetical protein